MPKLEKRPVISVLIVDDHAIVREGLRLILEQIDDIHVAGDFGNGRDAIAFCKKRYHPDVILMDLSMPLLNGLDTTKIITKKWNSTRVLILSMHTDSQYVNDAMHSGATGFLAKRTASKEIVTAIRTVYSGRPYFSSDIASNLVKKWNNSTGNTFKNNQILTMREREVVQLIAEGFSSPQIAAHLKISIKTVSRHRQNLMDKLDIHDVAGLTGYAIKHRIISPK
ncbi:response regulator [Candidatus Neomarinimicrobiota bacterium]